MLSASIPTFCNVAARRSGPSLIRRRRVESTRRTAGLSSRHVATSFQSGWHSQRRSVAPKESATATVRAKAFGSFTSSDRW